MDITTIKPIAINVAMIGENRNSLDDRSTDVLAEGSFAIVGVDTVLFVVPDGFIDTTTGAIDGEGFTGALVGASVVFLTGFFVVGLLVGTISSVTGFATKSSSKVLPSSSNEDRYQS